MHPGLENIIWSEITDDEITKKIGALQSRVGMANMGGNHQILAQLSLLLDSYYTEQERRLAVQYEDMLKSADPHNGSTSIDIDWDYNKKPEEDDE